jgi:hypothetical protein
MYFKINKKILEEEEEDFLKLSYLNKRLSLKRSFCTKKVL